MRILITGALAAVGVLALVGSAAAQGDNPDTGGRKLTATLSGAVEVPGPGDNDGTGLFEGRVNPGTGRICYTLTAGGIDAATAAHIHTGATGVAGGVVVPLVAPDGDGGEECQAIARDLAQELIQSPEAYYVNVHTAAFPAGAIRGQLSK